MAHYYFLSPRYASPTSNQSPNESLKDGADTAHCIKCSDTSTGRLFCCCYCCGCGSPVYTEAPPWFAFPPFVLLTVEWTTLAVHHVPHDHPHIEFAAN